MTIGSSTTAEGQYHSDVTRTARCVSDRADTDAPAFRDLLADPSALPAQEQTLLAMELDDALAHPSPRSRDAHRIAQHGTRKSWTRTGSNYAALVVRRDVGLSTRLDVLPRVGGNIVAIAIVEGVKK